MAYIHHMKGAEFREWSANRTLLIAPDNTVHRDASHDEERMDLPVEEDGVVYQLQRSRDRMASELFAAYPRQHVILRMPNGQLRHVKNSALKVSRGKGGTNRFGPAPEQCQCKPWGEPHPGRHHSICSFNRTAPREEQAIEHIQKQVLKSRLYGAGAKGTLTGVVMNPKAQGGASVVPSAASGSTAKPTAASNLRKVHTKSGKRIVPVTPMMNGVPVTPPADCDCAKYAGAVAGSHHSVCARREVWEAYLRANPQVAANMLQAKESTPAVVTNDEPAQVTQETEDLSQPDTETGGTDVGGTEAGGTEAGDTATGDDTAADDTATGDELPDPEEGTEAIQIEALEPSESGYYLVDVSTQKVARAADDEEVQQAMSTVVPLIKLQGQDYLVVEAAMLLK